MLGAGHTKAKMVVRSRQVPESEVMRALVSSALISGIDSLLPLPADTQDGIKAVLRIAASLTPAILSRCRPCRLCS